MAGKFLFVFNQGDFSEESTFLLSDWLAHTPPEVLAKNFQLSPESVAKLPTDSLYIFRGNLPESLEADIAEATADAIGKSPSYTFKLRAMAPSKKTAMGEARIVDSKNFPHVQEDCRCPRDSETWRSSRASLASERQGVAVLRAGLGAYDRLQFQRTVPHDGFQRERRRLCPSCRWPLH